MYTLDDLKKELMKDPEFVEEYNKVLEEMVGVRKEIEERIHCNCENNDD